MVSLLDGLAEWPASTTPKEWFAITRHLIQQTIADMNLDPAALVEVEEAFIGAGLLRLQPRSGSITSSNLFSKPFGLFGSRGSIFFGSAS